MIQMLWFLVAMLFVTEAHSGEVGEKDRKTEAEWAKEHSTTLAEVQKKFAASGTINCESETQSAVGSGQITVEPDILTTSAHIFVKAGLKADNPWGPTESCEKNFDPSECKFQTKVNGKTVSMDIEAVYRTGYICPNTAITARDWAVVKLKTPVKGVQPYPTAEEHSLASLIGKPVMTVIGNSVDFYTTINNKRVYLKSIAECQVHGSTGILWSSDCDAAQGASGGATLSSLDDGTLVLVGIVVANFGESDEQLKKATEGAVPRPTKLGPYKSAKSATLHVALTDDFSEAIGDATRCSTGLSFSNCGPWEKRNN